MQPKKQLILWILEALDAGSSPSTPLTQTFIANTVSLITPCERKTVCRSIQCLKAMGYPIQKTGGGFYLERNVFQEEEIAKVRASILANEALEESQRIHLANKVAHHLTKLYRRDPWKNTPGHSKKT